MTNETPNKLVHPLSDPAVRAKHLKALREMHAKEDAKREANPSKGCENFGVQAWMRSAKKED